MTINVLKVLEQQIVAAHPHTNRAEAFGIINQLLILDSCRTFGQVCEIEHTAEAPINPLDTLNEITKNLNPEMGPIRGRIQHMVDHLNRLIPALIPAIDAE